ncbi:unnamed protein product [Oikopleura dioica]|uniref:PWWP domain-containing protein n=1 Tax=Oikopleura dioica TaxID=34765 RepID=E4YG09_OIKDI|nr:unnamed protein product [Oikopleura dioica]
MIDECRFQFGDLVFAKVKDFPFWPARIDCVRLSSYKNGVQSDEPGSSTFWPVFFYGTRERLWINDRSLLPFEANRKELGNASTLKSFRQAMVEAFTKPLVDFQFKDISTKPQLEKMNAWLDGRTEEKEKTGWDEIVSESSDPSDDADSDMETDIGHELHETENVFIKITDLEVDDSFGVMFDRPLYGRVISKTKKQVKAQFYNRATLTSNEYHCRNAQCHVIPVDQQGFIFYHYDKKYVDYEEGHGGKRIMKMLTHEHDDVDQEWEKWNIHVMKFFNST